MQDEITIAIIIALVGVPLYIIPGNCFEKYDKRIQKIKIALVGKLVNQKDDLVSMELERIESEDMGRQEVVFFDLINFLKESDFLDCANEYDRITGYQVTGEKIINKVAVYFGALCVPVILLQQTGSWFQLGGVWAFFNGLFLLGTFSNVKDMVDYINRLHVKHVIEAESFGSYDS
jgi:hypothetical protein